MLDIVIAFIILLGGVVLILFSSKLAVKHSVYLASSLGISSFVIGITLVSIGTDISEIFNSIISSYLGHGDINVGDSVGSGLSQLTLVFGLLPIICGKFFVNRKQFLIIGSCEVLALILVFTVVEKGYFTHLDALFLILSLFFYILVSYNVTKDEMDKNVDVMLLDSSDSLNRKKLYYLAFATIGFLGVTLSSIMIIQSIIFISDKLNIEEFLFSFFILSLGTSLPELSVDITALKKKHYNLAIGDIIGSCIVDATLSIAIGNLFFPQSVSTNFAIPAIIYTIIVSLIVVLIVSKRQVMDKKSGVLFISLFLISIPILFAFYSSMHIF
ncbi:MAG: hypothetical protein KGD63_04590 [Candidatus Lokiarchaeota archaeon]|nr:hypothetical protein [Candidatus Lokiarchaeota archaeon]